MAIECKQLKGHHMGSTALKNMSRMISMEIRCIPANVNSQYSTKPQKLYLESYLQAQITNTMTPGDVASLKS